MRQNKLIARDKQGGDKNSFLSQQVNLSGSASVRTIIKEFTDVDVHIHLSNNHVFSPFADDSKGYQIIGIIQKGLDFKEFNNLFKEYKLPDTTWSKILGISPKTFERYKKENTKFNPLQSDFIIQISRTFNYGKEIFGEADKFTRWLSNQNQALGGIRPIELLNNPLGNNMVYSLLGRIDFGVYS